MEQGPCSSQLCSCHLRNEALVLPSLVVLENTAKLKLFQKERPSDEGSELLSPPTV